VEAIEMATHEDAQPGAGTAPRLLVDLQPDALEGDGVVLTDGAGVFVAEDVGEVDPPEGHERRGRIGGCPQERSKGAGEHVQYSVFRCDLSAREREQLISDLTEVIRPTEDQVLFVDLGPPDGRAATCIVALGRPYAPPGHAPIIV
jgi:CRISPR/Cas system-associated endoribonuclease Cas2